MKKVLGGIFIVLIVAVSIITIIHINNKDNNKNDKDEKIIENKIKKFQKITSLNLDNYSQNPYITAVNGLYILTYDENYKDGYDDTIVVMDSNYNILLREESVKYKIYDKSFIIYRKDFAKKYNIENDELIDDVNFAEMFNLYKNSYTGDNILYIYDDLYYINKDVSPNGFIYDAKLKKEIQTNLTNASYPNTSCYANLATCYIKNRHIAITKNGQTGVINDKNELVLDFEYDYNARYMSIPFYFINENSFIIRKNNQYQYINTQDNKKIENVIYIDSDKLNGKHLVKILNNNDKKYNVISYDLDGNIIDNQTYDNFSETNAYFEDYYVLLNNDNEIVYLTDDGKIHNKKFDNNILCHSNLYENDKACFIFKNKVNFKDGKYILYNGDNEVGKFDMIYELGDKILVYDNVHYGIIDKDFNYLLDVEYEISNYSSMNTKHTSSNKIHKNDVFVLHNDDSIIEYNKGNLSSPTKFNFDISKYKIAFIIDKEHIVVEDKNGSFPELRNLIDKNGDVLVSDFVNYLYIPSGYHMIEYWTKEKFNIKSKKIEIYDNKYKKISPEDLAAEVRTDDNLDKKFYLGLDGLYTFN